MKQTLLSTACSLPLLLATPSYAQSSSPCPDAKVIQQVQLDNATMGEKGEYVAFKMLPEKIDGKSWYVAVGLIQTGDILSALEMGRDIISQTAAPVYPNIHQLSVAGHTFEGCMYQSNASDTAVYVVPAETDFLSKK